MNNAVRNFSGKITGYRCFQCGGVFQMMWDNTCNECRAKNQQHNDLIAEVRKLRKALDGDKAKD